MRTRLFLRSFLIQASWNPRNLLGTGLAWAMKEGSTPPGNPDADTEWHFNSHPYLSGVAMGALERMKQEGASIEEIHRFRMALRGPLGALGDSLVWVGWLPVCLTVAGTALVLGLHPVGAAVLFLVLHNLLHLPLRWWGVDAGLRNGRGVALAFQRVNLKGVGRQTRAFAVLFSGILLGTLGVLAASTLERPVYWIAATSGMVLVGLFRGMALPGQLPGLVALVLLALGWLSGSF